MHRKIKKTIKYTGYIFLSLIIVLIAGISYLYYSADMMQPKHEPMIPMREVSYADTIIGMVPAEVIYNDTLDLRFYADNFLRHSESGLWELFVRGDALERGDAIGKLSADLLHHQEKVFIDQIHQIVPSDSYLKFLQFFIVLFAILVGISRKNTGRRSMESHCHVPMTTILSVLLTNVS